MQITKAIFLLCCLLVVGNNRVNAKGIDLMKALDCVEIAIEGSGYLGVKGVPILKNLAKCAKFEPDAQADLDLKSFIKIVGQLIKAVSGNPSCLAETLNEIEGYVKPYYQKLSARKCFGG